MPEPFIRIVVNAARQSRLTYTQFIADCKTARSRLHLRRPSRSYHLPQLIPQDALKRFYSHIDSCGNLQHQIMLRLLLFTGVRVAELTNIRVSSIDLTASKIFIDSGKGDKDRYVTFPDSFRLTLQSYLKSNPHNTYLFESQLKTKFTTRRIQQIVKDYAEAADMPVKVHPHLFRHQMLSFLTAQGLGDSQIQLISGHSSKASLEIYQHLSLEHVSEDYQKAVRKIDI